METITFKKHLNGLTRVDMEEYFDEAEVFNLLQWIDRIPLSRPRKHIGKDFADGVLLAEVVHHYFPRMVDIHNYTPASHMKQKIDNWYLLNRKVLRKLDLDLSDEVIRAMANEKKKVTEKVLLLLRFQIDKYLEKQGRSRREIDGDYVHASSPGLEKPGNISPRSERNNEQALVPYNSIKKGRSSPFKLSSPRKYERGEIPHNHPDRSLRRHRFKKRWRPKDIPVIRSYTPQVGSSTIQTRSYIIDDKVPVYDRPLYVLPTFDSVPRMLYEEREMEVMNKDETIKILNSKIRKLEHLLELKEIRIDDLQSQLAQVQGMFFVTKRSSIKR